jgi:hypothetical protein
VRRPALLLIAALALAAGAAPRSAAVRAEFQRLQPCPSTGLARGACPGWQVDHAVPLCLGGPAVDVATNLRWMPVEDHRVKTRQDLRDCRAAKTAGPY